MSRNLPSEGHVIVPDDYYRKELDAYSDWQFAWAREAGQNSLDAGASRISITVEKLGEDRCRITWQDNGIGMDRDDGEGGIVLFSRFLVLGASQKANGNVGGFGWAKKLLILAMHNYTIETGTIKLMGVGGSWLTDDMPKRRDGTLLVVEAPTDNYYILSGIRKWAEWTDTKGCTVTMNGEKLKTFDNKNIKGTKPLFDWANISNVKSDNSRDKNIRVRIGGQMMYSFRGPDELPNPVTLDITDNDSTKYFTSNRDSLKWKYRNEVNDFLKTLHRDPKTIQVLKVDKTINYGGEKGFIRLDGMSPMQREKHRENQLEVMLNNPELLADALRSAKLDQEAFGEAMHEGFNLSIITTIEKAIPKRFIPGTMSNPAIMWMTWWTSIIGLTGDVLHHSGTITPGWYFKADALACWQGRNGSGKMLLNPVNIDIKTGKITNRLDESRDCFNRMIVSCVHEFTHAQGSSYHSDEFCALNAFLVSKVMSAWGRYDELWSKLRSI